MPIIDPIHKHERLRYWREKFPTLNNFVRLTSPLFDSTEAFCMRISYRIDGDGAIKIVLNPHPQGVSDNTKETH